MLTYALLATLTWEWVNKGKSMKRLTKLLQIIPALLVLTMSAPHAADNRIGPDIPKAIKGEQCVEPNDVMRRDHMEFLKHQRDATMRDGIRTKKYSLVKCLECHVPTQEDQPVLADGDHFCKSCHMYAGISPDCFNCHNSRPEKNAAFHPLVSPAMNATRSLTESDSAELLNKMAATKTTAGGAQ